MSPQGGPGGGVWRARPARAVKLCKLEAQESQAGALDPPAGTLDVAWVVEGSGQLLLLLPIENEDVLSWRASRRPETFLSTGPCVFLTFDLQLKVAKSGVKACGGSKIGLVS